jgi:hypothetical protein
MTVIFLEEQSESIYGLFLSGQIDTKICCGKFGMGAFDYFYATLGNRDRNNHRVAPCKCELLKPLRDNLSMLYASTAFEGQYMSRWVS